jgi:hypothetical protein
VWTHADFAPMPAMAVAAALSRLNKEGTIRRIRKGVYHFPRKTRFGELAPDATSIATAVLKSKGIKWKPSGLPAYNGLGLTTQVSPSLALDVPRKISSLKTGSDTRPFRLRFREMVFGLSNDERALLDALRDVRRIPGSSPDETARKIKYMLATGRFSFDRLARHALKEPPRVRALLGAIGSEAGVDSKALVALRKSLNPITTFHLGVGDALPAAREWRVQ